MKFELTATATFGLEAVVRREIESLGFKITGREDGRITYIANEAGIVRSNLWLRTADRVLIKLGEFPARTFEDLFQGMKAIGWEAFVNETTDFSVNASSVKSQLSSVPACQSVAEKALIEKLSETYGAQRFSKSGAKFEVKIRLLKDVCTVTADTSGAGLHKRGYRSANVEAPMKETLAAALVSLSYWRAGRLLVDPFCGSGTIAIEAAMIGRNIAPGLNRKFAAEEWDLIPEEIWKQERAKAYKQIDLDADIRIEASDISRKAVMTAQENAENAGVEDCINFTERAFGAFGSKGEQGGVIVCNPPYGERIGDKQKLEKIYQEIKTFLEKNPTWSLFLITSDKEFEKTMEKPADRRRKLYNGRIETTYYQYHGEKRTDKSAEARGQGSDRIQ